MFSSRKSSAPAAAVSVADPQFNYVTALLHGDGTNGAQNNTFIDSSTNAFTITRNGTPTQGSFSPYGTLWSNYFNGSTDYLSVATNAALSISGNVDASIEFFIFATSAGIVVNKSGVSGSSYANYQVSVNSNGSITFFVGSSGSPGSAVNTLTTNAGTLILNTWNHVVCTKNYVGGGPVNYYRVMINGILIAYNSQNNPSDGNPTALTIGHQPSASGDYLTGYVSNLRIFNSSIPSAYQTSSTTTGTTIYTVPSAPLSASTSSLLISQSNRFVDNSSNAFSLTVSGSPSVQRFNPFLPTSSQAYSTSVYGGSAYGDGSSGNYLTAPSNAVFALGSNNFTIEGWIYLTQFNTYNFVYNRASGTTNATTEIEVNINSSGTLSVAVYIAAVGITTTAATGAITLNQWQHIAFVRNGTSGQIYINGVASGSASSIVGALNNTSSSPTVMYQAVASNRGMTGYLSDFRIVNGTAVYTTNFTPPTAPITAVTNTALLLSMQNAGIYDNAMMNDGITVGSAQISTSVKKYGSGSLSFNGSTDYLVCVPPTNSINSLSTAFTIEMWIYRQGNGTTGSTAYDAIIGSSSAGTAIWGIYVTRSNGVLNFYDSTGLVSTSSSITNNTWTHIAVCRTSSNNLQIFINGVSGYSASNTGTGVLTTQLYVGKDNTGTNYYYYGYIDDLRITQGYARYTSNFTPPTAALPNYGM